MADGVRLSSAVMFVRDLDRSVSFYSEVLALEEADRSTSAALLVSAAGAQLILRAMGAGAAHPLGSLGVQYVVWTAAGPADLDRSERALKNRSAHQQRRSSGGVTVIEGRDPDDLPVLIAYPGPDQMPLHELPMRIYGW